MSVPLVQRGVTVLVVFLLTAGIGLAETIPGGAYRYQEVTGDEKTEFSWQISYEGELVEIRVEGEDHLMINRCRRNGETFFWSVQEKGKTEVTAIRKEDTLHLVKREEQGPASEEHAIDDRPWFQPLSYSLRRFLFSDKEKISFWCVRQDTREVVPLTAKKIAREKLLVGPGEFNTIKVEIRMAGIFAPFWHGTYWFREDTGQFLQYQGVNGPPGTAETTISLVERLES